MRRLIAVFLLSACATAPRATTFTEAPVTYRNGDLLLAAALLVPEGARNAPAAVILQGSGASDRGNLWAREVAESMARRGIVVLLTDKRGSGLSQGDWRQAGFEELAKDALAGVAFLKTRREAGKVGLVGLSQGGHVAPLAASMSEDVAFVVDVSGATTTAVEQVNHEMRNTFREAGVDVERGMKLQELAGHYIRTGAWEPYEAALQAALESDLAPVAKGFPQTRDSWVWTFWRRIGDFDPIPHWRSIRQPVLIVYGQDDENDNVPVAESVRRIRAVRPDATVQVYPGSGHALYEPGTHELRRDFVELLSSWIHRV